MRTSNILLLILLASIFFISAVELEMVETISGEGIRVIKGEGESESGSIDRPENLWQVEDAAAICGEVFLSGESNNSLARWQTNNERVSLYNGDGEIEWENMMGNLDFDYPVDMTESGSIIAIASGGEVDILEPETSVPIWSWSFIYDILAMQLNGEGNELILSFQDNEGICHIQKYGIYTEFPVWETSYAGGCNNLVLSEDDSRLIFTQYGGIHNNMYVLDAETGAEIFAADEYNQNAPAISADGSLIVNGDYSGYVWVYEYNETTGTYSELWHYHVNGGGSSDWIGGMGVSADGSTIAVGTLTFLSEGYNGQIYLFNRNSPTPIWVYEDAGDYVIDLDLSADGSLVAAAGYGPYGEEGSELMIFRRESNMPIYELDSPGSLFSVDLSPDGSRCVTGGKGVHAREMGSGGYVYCVDSNAGGGAICGTVTLSGAVDHSGICIEAIDLEDYYTYSDSLGSFLLEYLPEGLHTLQYSKIGYESYTCFDGVVVAGEVMEVPSVELVCLGAGPENLRASQAAGPEIELIWEAAAGTEPAGYFIYRKRYAPDAYPQEPLAIVFGNEPYIDETALPGLEYYYAVSAMTDTGEQTPLSNEACGWTSTGFIAEELSVYYGSEPVIDGVIDAQEWSDAYRFDASDFWGTHDNTAEPVGSVEAYLKMDAGGNLLYGAFINHNDPLLEDHDEVALYIDDNGDGSYPDETDNSEGNYWAVYYEAGNELKHRPIYNTGSVGTVVYLPDPQVAASDASGSVVFEFAIPFGEEDWEINLMENNSSTIGIFMLDDNDPDPHGFDAWWPHDNINIFDPADYGNIHYGASVEEPSAPTGLYVEEIDQMLHLSWLQPQMNDFEQFKIYFALNDEAFGLIDSTEGISWYYEYEFYPQTSYSFYLTTVNQSGMESAVSEIIEYFSTEAEAEELVSVTSLAGNYPNPFNPCTTIRFNLARAGRAELEIYNIKGQKLKTLTDEIYPAGSHEIVWKGETSNGMAASGIYFYKLKTSEGSISKRMLLLK